MPRRRKYTDAEIDATALKRRDDGVYEAVLADEVVGIVRQRYTPRGRAGWEAVRAGSVSPVPHRGTDPYAKTRQAALLDLLRVIVDS